MDRYMFDPYGGDVRLLLPDPDKSTSRIRNEDGSPAASNQIQMFASSKHLDIASPVFKAMLHSGNFRESTTSDGKKHVEIPLPSDDAAAFEVVLNIIHGRTQNAPQKVDLSLLTKLSVLVDKYRFHEALKMFSDQWFNKIKGSIKGFGPHLPLWLSITWVFNQKSHFGELTSDAIWFSNKSLRGSQTDDLPIPSQVFDDIQTRRVQAIGELIHYVQALLTVYRSTDIQCTSDSTSNSHFLGNHKKECDAMMLGCLEKFALDSKIEPTPASPSYKNMSLDDLSKKVMNFPFRSLCDRLKTPASLDVFGKLIRGPAHDVLENLETKVTSIERSVKAKPLDITEYRSNKV